MLLKAKRLAFLGLLLAFDVLLIILSSILEFNTLFFLAAASFCVGIAIRETGLRIGSGFYLASILLSVILAPNKLYCITYGAMGFYLVVSEYAYDRLINVKRMRNKVALLGVVKYIAFNCVFLPILFFLPKLIYSGEMKAGIYAALIIGGQVALYIYDWAYTYFQKYVWGRFRKIIKLQ